MRGGHAHEESAIIAALVLVFVGLSDLFVDIADEHPGKIVGYFGLFWLAYLIARLFRNRAWK